jgi:hypothetical protein
MEKNMYVSIPADATASGSFADGGCAYLGVTNMLQRIDVKDGDAKSETIMVNPEKLRCIDTEYHGWVDALDKGNRVWSTNVETKATEEVATTRLTGQLVEGISSTSTGTYLQTSSAVMLVDKRCDKRKPALVAKCSSVTLLPDTIKAVGVHDNSTRITAVGRRGIRPELMVWEPARSGTSIRSIPIDRILPSNNGHIDSTPSACGRYVLVVFNQAHAHLIDVEEGKMFTCATPKDVARRCGEVLKVSTFVDPARGAAFMALWQGGTSCNWYVDRRDCDRLVTPCEDVTGSFGPISVSDIVAVLPRVDDTSKLTVLCNTDGNNDMCTMHNLSW